MTLKIEGFPGYTSERIDLPNIAELMFMPFFNRIDADSFRSKCSDIQRMLLDKTPLLGTKKYTIVDSYAVFITKDSCFVGTRSQAGQLYEWHMDGIRQLNDENASAFHIFQTESDCPTIFNGSEIDVALPEDIGIGEFNTIAAFEAQNWVKEEVAVEANRFVTFQKHLHRSSQPKGYAIRYFFRVTESDTITPAREGSRPNPMPSSYHHIVDANGMSKITPSITHAKDGLTIHFPVPYLRGDQT